MDILDESFYSQDTAIVAKKLLGKHLVRIYKDTVVSGKIVETEAYYGENDPPSRAYKGYNNFAKLMWDKPGKIFIYMVHSNWLLNIVTMSFGVPSAVLIRAIEPLEGLDFMLKNRSKHGKDLSNGPGKLTQAMDIDKSFNGLDATNKIGNLYVKNSYENYEIKSSNRIGVKRDLERKLRFFISGNKYVSK